MQAPSLVRVPRRGGEAVVLPLESPGFRSVLPVSVSLPASPSGFGAPTPVGGGGGGDSDVDLRRQAAANASREPLHSPASQAKGGGNGVRFVQPERMMFLSQPIPGGQPSRTATRGGGGRAMCRDKRYDSFKTWSGKLERQLTHLAGVGPEAPVDKERGDAIGSHHTSSLPKVDRFFAALEGPELDQLKVRGNKKENQSISSILHCCCHADVTRNLHCRSRRRSWCCRRTRHGRSCCGSRCRRSVCAWG